MFSSRHGWCLSFAFLAIVFLLYASIGLWFDHWLVGTYEQRSPNALDTILSPDTVDALRQDARLHGALLSLTETVAKVSSDYGSTFRMNGLTRFGKDLTAKVQHIRIAHPPKPKAKRQTLMGGLLSAGDAGGGLLDGILGEAGNGSGGLGDLFGQALSGLGGDLADSLATPAYFLGIGIGYVDRPQFEQY